ncbi:hypothetical protein GWI33_012204 [Rhynchophorus ferrugineus]|uniref:Uncharacterized protein n=1 Tax=Rhynchophorus ferrugineus TaxID=354439 RepID=A0A834IBQ2_RHYFE|nr:hypothetical protein GWI33_012204 [Rhynchophorus ferrugineus]
MIRRRRLKQELVLVVIFTICTFTYLYSQIIKSDDSERDDMSYHFPKKSLLSVEYSPNSTTETWRLSTSTRKRYTTKSMSELGKMDDINPHFLFINWMAGNGAEILVFLLEKVQGMNSFRHVRLKETPAKHLTSSEQENITEQMNLIRREMAVPLSFDRNTDFINFTYFDKQSPTYLSLVRDPVIKMVKQ